MKQFSWRAILGSILFLAALNAHAQLVVEITRGQENAVPIAIVPFGWESQGAAPFDVAEVVANDLQRSGRFAPEQDRLGQGADHRGRSGASRVHSPHGGSPHRGDGRPGERSGFLPETAR